MRSFLLLILVASPAFAASESMECPFPVVHVGVEVGSFKPFPDLIPPDVTGNDDTDLMEWNYLSNRPTNIPITVHCYPNKYSKIETDIALPLNVKKCRLENKRFSCE